MAAVLLGLSVFFLMAGKMHERAEVRRVISGHPGETRTVIIDPGHGGEDGGAVGVDGAIEKDINLAVSLKLRDLLTVQGYEVLMTRENDHMMKANRTMLTAFFAPSKTGTAPPTKSLFLKCGTAASGR